MASCVEGLLGQLGRLQQGVRLVAVATLRARFLVGLAVLARRWFQSVEQVWSGEPSRALPLDAGGAEGVAFSYSTVILDRAVPATMILAAWSMSLALRSAFLVSTNPART